MALQKCKILKGEPKEDLENLISIDCLTYLFNKYWSYNINSILKNYGK